jgi:hypothetical protein
MWAAIILIFWCIWKHRNDVVVNGATALELTIREKIKVEYYWWRLAKLFCGVLFSFPEPVDLLWQAGE